MHLLIVNVSSPPLECDGIMRLCCATMCNIGEGTNDYVVVHELCYRNELNHSPRFWNEVARVMPDYAARRKWLKENGGALIRRLG